MRRPLDGAGDQVGKEGDEGEVGTDILGRLQLSAIDINRVAESLEGVEADSRRQNENERRSVDVNSDGGEKNSKAVGKEVEVLEKPNTPRPTSTPVASSALRIFGLRLR